MLKFLGIGSAFNTKLGNNSAYIKNNKTLLLIDCGETVFPEIEKLNLLKDIKEIYIAITHTHGDHAGSLSSLILYCHYILKVKPTIIHPHDDINIILDKMGSEKEVMYSHDKSFSIPIENLNLHLSLHPIQHSSKLKSVCLRIKDLKNNKLAYFSGDSKEISKEDLEFLTSGNYDYFYQDTASLDYEGSVHLSFNKLKELIKPEFRHIVYSMHLDGKLSKDEIEKEGFNVVEVNEV